MLAYNFHGWCVMPIAFLLVRIAGMLRFTTSLAIRRHVLQNTAATVTCTERGVLRKSATPGAIAARDT